MLAMKNILEFSNAFVSTHEIKGSILAKRLSLHPPGVTFKTKAKQVLQQKSVVSAFSIQEEVHNTKL